MSNPVLLLHGFATSAFRTWAEPGWLDIIGESGREVIAPDLLGHGEAEKPHDPAPYASIEDDLLASLPEGPIDAIGYSAGARILLVLASRQPERFGRIVIGGMGERLFQPRESTTILDAVRGEDTGDDREAAHFADLASTDGNDREALALFISRDQPRLDREHCAQITARTLVVIGSEDFAGPGEGLAEAIPGAGCKTLRGVDHFGLPKAPGFLMAALGHLDI